MKLSLKVLVILIVGLTSCTSELDPSSTENLIQNNFKVKVTSYGGFIGKREITYQFNKKADSVNVEIIYHSIRPKEKFHLTISNSTFVEIQNQLICLSSIESDTESERAYQLFDAEYLISSGLNKIYIRPKAQDTCRFYQELPEYDTMKQDQ